MHFVNRCTTYLTNNVLARRAEKAGAVDWHIKDARVIMESLEREPEVMDLGIHWKYDKGDTGEEGMGVSRGRGTYSVHGSSRKNGSDNGCVSMRPVHDFYSTAKVQAGKVLALGDQ